MQKSAGRREGDAQLKSFHIPMTDSVKDTRARVSETSTAPSPESRKHTREQNKTSQMHRTQMSDLWAESVWGLIWLQFW